MSVDDADDAQMSVGPHAFDPLARFSLPFLFRGNRFERCRACYLPRAAHPTTEYHRARPIGDRSVNG